MRTTSLSWVMWGAVLAAGASSVAGCSNSASACGPSSCTGCCDSTGVCHGPSSDACGVGGVTCEACQPFQTCVGGLCQDESGNGATATNGTTGTLTGGPTSGPGSSSGLITVGASTGGATQGNTASSTGGATLATAVTTSGGTTASPAASSSGTTGSPTATTASSSSGTTGVATTTTSTGGTSGSTGGACTNLQCDQGRRCADGGSTLITGTIMDPAGADPLYNVVAYVPNTTVEALPSGATCATCSSLFSGTPIAVGLSDTDGNFSISDAPVASSVPVIIQVGKWRTHTTVSNVQACAVNSVGTIKLPSAMDSADPIINLPDIAVSTGGADSLECLLVRVGISPSEYVAGASSSGKVHIFNGGQSGGGLDAGAGGLQESNPMVGAPNSDQALWNSSTSMQPYDIVLLSCEGDETYDAMPTNLATYLDTQGGRVFASHYHYSWFTGSTEGQTPSYTSPSEWGTDGNAIASWVTGSPDTASDSANADLITTLASGAPFPKGLALQAWLGNVHALGVVPAGPPAGTCAGLASNQLCVAEVRENSTVTASDTGSQGWLTDPTAPAGNGSTLYFSFDTPLGSNASTDTCPGRAVFSGLHVGGASYDSVNCENLFGTAFCSGPQATIAPAPPPAGCDTAHGLSPQEKALEFMLFDLSSCVVPDTANPADAGGPVWTH